MAHLMRRAGFGASYEELERRVLRGYEVTVEELLQPEAQPDLGVALIRQYMIDWTNLQAFPSNYTYWTFWMVNSPRPLEEKICLFWHSIFCVGQSKCMDSPQIRRQLDKFRRHGLGRFDHLLAELASDPAMIYYLDNQLSHKNAINENWGRELLELFSMGVGMDGHPNYTEEDYCLEMLGGYQMPDHTRALLKDQIQKDGVLQTGAAEFSQRVGQILQLIVSTQEYQFA